MTPLPGEVAGLRPCSRRIRETRKSPPAYSLGVWRGACAVRRSPATSPGMTVRARGQSPRGSAGAIAMHDSAALYQRQRESGCTVGGTQFYCSPTSLSTSAHIRSERYRPACRTRSRASRADGIRAMRLARRMSPTVPRNGIPWASAHR